MFKLSSVITSTGWKFISKKLCLTLFCNSSSNRYDDDGNTW